MPRYRKKAVEIDAFRLVMGAAMPAWFIEALVSGKIEPITPSTEPNVWGSDGVAIYGDCGLFFVKLGDWVIREGEGRFTGCRPEIFEATYEAVDD